MDTLVLAPGMFIPVSRFGYLNPNGNWSTIIDYFYQNNQKVVIKQNYGSEGKGVYLCDDIRDVEKAVASLMLYCQSVSICPFYSIKNEYRAFFLSGDILMIYRKMRPFVTGDGKNDLNQLIQRTGYNISNTDITNLDLKYVPYKDEIVYITWKHNLFYGSIPEIIPYGNLFKRISELAKSAAHVMNISFATIDIIETEQSDFMVLEINSGVCMTKFTEFDPSHYDIAKNIYKKAMIALMKE